MDIISTINGLKLYLFDMDGILHVCDMRSIKDEFISNGFKVIEDTALAECIVMGFDTELIIFKDIMFLHFALNFCG